MVRAVNMPGSRRALLEQLFMLGVSQCQPATVLPPVLPKQAPAGRNIVLGAGKAAAEMAAVASARLPGRTEGLVVTRYGHGTDAPTGNIEVVEASHPVPDQGSLRAAERLLGLAAAATADDRVLFLISGGGSALLSAPIEGVSPARKQDITRFLLHSGAPIGDINCVRKHLSRIKGGGLAEAAHRAEQMTFAISDVVGDELSDIASGPSIPFRRDAEAAIGILEKYGYEDVESVAEAMRAAEPINAPEHPAFLVATASTALDAIAQELEDDGWTVVRLGDGIEGDATEVAREHADVARRYSKEGGRYALVSGGELTVEVSNRDGRGGPNLEYLTSLAIALDGAPGIEAIACDSDGIDGSEDNAGGYISSTSLARASELELDAAAKLASNDSYTLFEKLGDLIVTGPTRTNVNDIRVILIAPEKG